MDLEVVIEGVSDAELSKEIERAIREVCKKVARSGQWSVTVSPSETRGQWDLGVRRPSGPCFISFFERGDALPGLIANQLRACLSP